MARTKHHAEQKPKKLTRWNSPAADHTTHQPESHELQRAIDGQSSILSLMKRFIIEHYEENVTAIGSINTSGIYHPDYMPAIAYQLCSIFGATHADLAEIFGIADTTINTWMVRNRDFQFAVKDGRDYFETHKIEKALTNRALGYEYTETDVAEVTIEGERITENTRNGVTTVTKIFVPGIKTTVKTKHQAASTTALLFYLQNRAPNRWKNVRHVEASIKAEHKHAHLHQHQGSIQLEFDPKDLSTEELRLIYKLTGGDNLKPELLGKDI